ncbi:MAG: hypothetical protein NPIRA06_26120 [Nitrospirales bacterium]|nr:MAG: hypothetical protein NPIRA06_26120 [Nitrospirales bacterium]
MNSNVFSDKGREFESKVRVMATKLDSQQNGIGRKGKRPIDIQNSARDCWSVNTQWKVPRFESPRGE